MPEYTVGQRVLAPVYDFMFRCNADRLGTIVSRSGRAAWRVAIDDGPTLDISEGLLKPAGPESTEERRCTGCGKPVGDSIMDDLCQDCWEAECDEGHAEYCGQLADAMGLPRRGEHDASTRK